MKRRQLLGWSAALPLSAAVTGGHAQANKDTLRIAWTQTYENVDPYYGATREGLIMSRHIYDTLIYADPNSDDFKPLLATAWRWVDDLTLEFTLRQGVKFHNGAAFSADDVVDTFNRVIKPDSGVKVRSIVDWIKGAEKVDPYKVRVRLVKPYPAALEVLAGQLGIHSSAYFAQVGREGVIRAPIGTGPYRLKSQETDKGAVLERFDGYFEGGAKGKPAIKTIEVKVIPDANTQMANLMTGQVDWIWRVSSDLADKLAKVPNITLESAETMRYVAIAFDAAGRAGKSPVQDARVRQAFAYAINRQSLRDNLVKGKSRVLHSPCFPGQFGCSENVTRYSYDPARAKKLLADAGFPNGFEMPMLAYTGKAETEAVAADLAKVGIKVNLRFLRSPVVRKMMEDNEAQLVMLSWGSYSVNDVSAAISMYFDGGSYDMTRDAQVRDWIRVADNSVNKDLRKRNYQLALDRISKEAFWLPLTTTVTNYAHAKNLKFRAPPDEVPTFFDCTWA